MNASIRRGVIVEISLGGLEEKWSGSGFIMSSIEGPSSSSNISYMVVTSTSWMRDVLVIPRDVHKCQPCLMKDAKINVFWHNDQEDVFHKSTASIVCIEYLQKVHKTLKELEGKSLSDWRVASNHGNQDNNDLVYLSCLAFLSFKNKKNLYFPPIPVASIYTVSIADDVCMISTPFGSSYPKIFYNSVSSGCVSNKYGNDDAVFMIDTRCVPGSEGGMVLKKLVTDELSLVGVVISNLVDGNNVPVNASLVCTIAEETFKHINFKLNSNLSFSSINNPLSTTRSPLTPSCSSVSGGYDGLVVPVLFGSSVGSGIIVSDSHVVTCGHVVKGMKTGIIQYCNRNVPVSVLYSTAHGPLPHGRVQSHPDIAILLVNEVGGVLKCTNDFLNTVNDFQCSVGEPVISIGYTYQNPFLINARSNPSSPSVSSGIISKLVPSVSCPVMIQTTLCIYQAMSGGLLYSTQSHTPLGILVCVAKDDTMSHSYSRVSFVIPFSWIRSAILTFIRSKDAHSFANLEGSELWSLDSNESLPIKILSCKL